MDLKKIITIIVGLFLSTMVFLFCFQYIFHADLGSGNVFGTIGNTAVDTDFRDTESESNTRLDALQNTSPPEVEYVGFVCVTSQAYNYKSLIQVKTGAEWYSGEMEEGFTISLVSVMTEDGESIYIGKGDTGVTDEIFSKVHVDAVNGTIVFNERGVFRLGMKVYGANGRYTYVEVKVPVED